MSFFDQSDERIHVKICGITQAEQARRIIDLGADAIGVNFWPQSKRYIALDDARPWLEELSGKVTRVGVFVNASKNEIARVLESGAIDYAQLHGDESIEELNALLNEKLPVFKALGIRDRDALELVVSYPGDAILLDAYAPSEYGGTGESFDWNLGRIAVEQYSQQKKIILAGGLTPNNVADAVRQVRPFAVDTASGVESGTPGIKDLDKVKHFIDAAKNPGA